MRFPGRLPRPGGLLQTVAEPARQVHQRAAGSSGPGRHGQPNLAVLRPDNGLARGQHNGPGTRNSLALGDAIGERSAGGRIVRQSGEVGRHQVAEPRRRLTRCMARGPEHHRLRGTRSVVNPRLGAALRGAGAGRPVDEAAPPGPRQEKAPRSPNAPTAAPPCRSTSRVSAATARRP